MGARREMSLRLRLSLFFAALLLAAWSVAALFSWLATVEHIDTFFDTQQMLFAKRLASARYDGISSHLPDTGDILALAGQGDEGEQEDDALAFAVFSHQGDLLLSDGDNGKQFIFDPKANGFVNTRLDDDLWRIVWLSSLDGRVIVAVGQEQEYRDDMVWEILAGQMLPWLCLLPVLLLGLTLMLTRELAPLRLVAEELGRRRPNDLTPVEETGVQPEVRPLVKALNSLFRRIEDMLGRERVFIANAAHELRTPLAGLSIQAQVAGSARQPETRAHALSQLRKGIDRTSRLVDQLLLLFKLESLDVKDKQPNISGHDFQSQMLDWEELIEAALEEEQGKIEAKRIIVRFQNSHKAGQFKGSRDILEVLLRNIIGNAVKYTPEGGMVEITLDNRGLLVQNSSRDISADDAARLGERFFRPPGQQEPGSGLGLSIAQKISDLYGFNMAVQVTPGCFLIRLVFI